MDERTPQIKELCFRNIQAKNCHVAAAFFYGLPEQKIERVEMKHIQVSYAEDAASGQPAMMDGIRISVKWEFLREISKLWYWRIFRW